MIVTGQLMLLASLKLDDYMCVNIITMTSYEYGAAKSLCMHIKYPHRYLVCICIDYQNIDYFWEARCNL